MTSMLNIKPNDQKSLVEEFSGRLNEFCLLAEKEGIKLKASDENSWNHFNSLDLAEQERLYSNFKNYFELCSSALNEDGANTDDISLVWYAIRKLNLRPKSDLFEKIEQGDIIEIYDSSFIQIFRNFKYFEISSYTLTDIFTNEWRNLYRRSQNITDAMALQGIGLFSGTINETVAINAGEHFVEEIFSCQEYKLHMNPKYFSPLYDKNNQVAAVVATSRVNLVESKKAIPLLSNEIYGSTGL